ncbi:OB-fold protein [Cesiribacter andamanensis]|uniref:tRNA anti-like protein n=1 Tax=Cesiribacter andamanensis AMV16 TaxID=1279009 RepID=M7NLK1_9BACT|nr:tRNA anti -like protein [Cesiribacter andamanensis]EMR02660.1 tRNA anti -like protein [Cesiribacter andamanensis AMV16]
MKKTLLFLGAILLLAAAAVAYLQYNKPHRNTSNEAPAYALSALELLQEYETDEAAANAKYLDKLLQVNGQLREYAQAQDGTYMLMLETGNPMAAVSSELLPGEGAKLSRYQPGDQLTFKGICTGKLMDVVLVRSVILEEEK